MNFGSPNLTKQKKKKSLRTQQNVTQKRIIGTHQNVTTFSQYFLFPTVVGLSLILLFYFFMSTSFLQQIFGEKLLLILKLCIKKKTIKDNTRKLCVKL